MLGGSAGIVPGTLLGGAFGYAIGDKGSQLDKIQQSIVSAAKQMGVDPPLALAVAAQESSFRQFDKNGNVLRSSAGAFGIMQLMPGTPRATWASIQITR
jgi:soluble lytic murein transglycosylase-like protein